MQDASIIARNVSKRFVWRGADVQALLGVSLEVGRGELFALLGPNGAGKSTLINILMGILTPDEGEVRVLGQEIFPGAAVYERIGYASGEGRFHWALTPRDVLDLFARAYGLDRVRRRRRVAELLEEMGLSYCAGRKYDLLSTGEKMRLVLAKAFVHEPQIVLLDEPTVGLDPDGAVSIRREIARLNRERGVTILMTSHYMREVEELASRIAFIRGGRILDTGPAGGVIARAMPCASFVAVSRAPEGAEEELASLGFERRGERRVRLGGADEDLGAMLARLAGLGIGAADLEIGRPTLEDYFIHMVRGTRREDQ